MVILRRLGASGKDGSSQVRSRRPLETHEPELAKIADGEGDSAWEKGMERPPPHLPWPLGEI